MRRILVLTLVVCLVAAFTLACKPKPKPTPPPPPQAKEQPKVEKVAEPAAQKPQLSEEEMFLAKSLDEMNKMQPLRMVHFDYDKFAVRDDAKPVLEANSAWLKKFRTIKVLIEGHCDERGTEDYNLALGEKRSKSVFDYLVSLGIPAERMKTISYGKSQPLSSGHDEAAWGQNRRAQFLIIEK